MESILGMSLHIRNYKSIGNNPVGFENIQPINVVIGKNNSGKTSLLNALKLATNIQQSVSPDKLRNGLTPTISLACPLTEDVLRRVFPEGTSGGEFSRYKSFWEYGKQFLDKLAVIELKCGTNTKRIVRILDSESINPDIFNLRTNYVEQLSNNIKNVFANKKIVSIDAERDIGPETHSADLSINGSGKGVTNVIQNFLVSTELDNRIIHEDFLNCLNEICNPDIYFNRIECKRNSGDTWEIFLDDIKNGPTRLSNMGSGIKTILHILAATILSPLILKCTHSNIILCIEEPENNLHPSMLRRLADYIHNHSTRNNSCVFITTHSSTVIDHFSKAKNSSTYHININNSETTIKQVLSYKSQKAILDDLEIRASDLLQANGIIWVEGPSDRTYLNEWIDIWSEGTLREGMHYQIVFYGGRLLSHLHSDPFGEKLINIMNINRNNIILIDSDRKSKNSKINETKSRVCKEVEQMGGHCWITYGKEIENYISPRIVSILLDQQRDVREAERFENFFSYLDEIKPRSGTRFKDNKQQLAEIVSGITNKDDMLNRFDLPKQLDEICSFIRRWNNM